MKIVAIGGTGLIGSKTIAILRQRGHEAVLEFFENSGRNLLAAEAVAGVRHHVSIRQPKETAP